MNAGGLYSETQLPDFAFCFALTDTLPKIRPLHVDRRANQVLMLIQQLTDAWLIAHIFKIYLNSTTGHAYPPVPLGTMLTEIMEDAYKFVTQFRACTLTNKLILV
jgi:hypothetical protein